MLQTEKPVAIIKERIAIETIENGYLVTLEARPSVNDPMAQRSKMVFAAQATEIGAAVDLLVLE